MVELEFGRVTLFSAGTKKSGHLVVLDKKRKPTNETVLFHVNAGQWVGIEEGQGIVFSGRVSPIGHTTLPVPKVGDVLAFERASGRWRRTKKVSSWTYAADYSRLVDIVASRIYRIKKRASSYESVSEKESLTGRFTAEQMSANYPIWEVNGEIVDSLTALGVGYSFQRWVSDFRVHGGAELIPGYWMDCRDPRRVIYEESAKKEA